MPTARAGGLAGGGFLRVTASQSFSMYRLPGRRYSGGRCDSVIAFRRMRADAPTGIEGAAHAGVPAAMNSSMWTTPTRWGVHADEIKKGTPS